MVGGGVEPSEAPWVRPLGLTLPLVACAVLLLAGATPTGFSEPLSHRTSSLTNPGASFRVGGARSGLAAVAGRAPIAIAGQITVGGGSTQAIYDPVNGYLYDIVGASLWVIHGLAVAKVLTLTEGGYEDYPELWLDPLNGYIYTAVWLGSTVSLIGVVNGTAFVGNVTAGGESSDIAFDTANGWAYVANTESGNVSVIAGATLVASPRVPDPGWATYDPSTGDVYVAGGNGQGVLSVLNGTSLVANVPVGSGAGKPVWDAQNGYVYVPNQGSDNVSVINGTALIASVDVSVGPFASLYDGANGYLYVQCVADGGINVSVIHGTALVATLPISSWGLTPAGFVQGPNGELYVGDPAAGAVVVVNGTEIAARVVVDPIEILGSPEYVWLSSDSANGYVYAAWTNVGAHTSASNVSVINGSTDIGEVEVPGFEAQPPVWDAEDGLGYVVDIIWAHVYALTGGAIPTYRAQFTESGLGLGTEWSILLGNTTAFSTGASVTLWEPNGTYFFAVGATGGYEPKLPNGTIIVQGEATVQIVAFTPPPGPPFPVGSILLGGLLVAIVLGAVASVRRGRRGPRTPLRRRDTTTL